MKFFSSRLQTLPSNGLSSDVFLSGCPHYLIHKSPAVSEALEAHRWWSKGQLADLYPSGIPAVVVSAVSAISNGFARAERERFEELERKRSKQTAARV